LEEIMHELDLVDVVVIVAVNPGFHGDFVILPKDSELSKGVKVLPSKWFVMMRGREFRKQFF
jgi:pentose-5-phosphate-3-epimerase